MAGKMMDFGVSMNKESCVINCDITVAVLGSNRQFSAVNDDFDALQVIDK
jgi:hypothetical protein